MSWQNLKALTFKAIFNLLILLSPLNIIHFVRLVHCTFLFLLTLQLAQLICFPTSFHIYACSICRRVYSMCNAFLMVFCFLLINMKISSKCILIDMIKTLILSFNCNFVPYSVATRRVHCWIQSRVWISTSVTRNEATTQYQCAFGRSGSSFRLLLRRCCFADAVEQYPRLRWHPHVFD